METKVNYTVVGAFVVGLTAALLLIALWLTVGLTHKKYQYYLTYINESVSGLSKDAPVKYNGVNIGLIEDISLNPYNLKQVRLLLAVDPKIPIKTDTVATLVTQGLTGISYLNLSGGSPQAPILKAQEGARYAVIRSEPSLFFRLDNVVRDLAQSVTSVSRDLHDILSEENQQQLKITLKELPTTLKQMNDAAAKFTAASREGQIAIQAFSNQTMPQVMHTFSNLQKLTSHMNQITIEMENNPSILVRGRAPLTPGPGE